MNREIETDAATLADLTFRLLSDCEQKENLLALKYELTIAEFRCLKYFNENEYINNKLIAAKMNLSPSRLTRIIDGLEEKGYLSREVNRSDRRNLKLYLTSRGVTFVAQLNSEYIRIHKEILDHISDTHHKPLIEAVSQLSVAMKKWLDEK